MARKKELMELENPTMEENTLLDGTGIEDGAFLGERDGTLPEAAADGMDLNELLGNMDQEPSAEAEMESGMLPELTEDEMFGEIPGDTAACGMDEDADDSGETQPESASTPETGVPAAKGRPTTRRKKEDSSEKTDKETQKMENGMPEVSETTSDDTPHSPDTSAIPDTDGLSGHTTNEITETAPPEDAEPSSTESGETDFSSGENTSAAPRPMTSPSRRATGRGKPEDAPVLTLEVRGEVETEESREDTIWHEIHNAYRTRRILTGQLGGIEQTDNGKTITIVDYKGFRIVIPLKEMMINIGRSPSGQEYTELMLRQNKILGNMLGAEIDFIVKGIDSKSRSVVASRKEAMLRKRQIFYLDTDAAGMYRIYEGRIAQARVIAVAEKVIRVEIFGVECSIMARDLAWDWIGDAHERFSVGDQVLVRILNVRRDSLEDIGIKADIKSVSQNTNHDNLKKCRIQSKYAGKVTDIHKGVVYIRLSNGVNAVAHSCYDYRTPGKKDDVSFAVTRLDEERGVAVGIITRIIRQNL